MPAGSPSSREDRVIAEMRIAVDHAEAAERKPPGGEHRGRQRIARRKRIGLVRQHAGAVEPIERQQPSGGERRPGARHPHAIDAVEHFAVQRDVLGFAPVVELLAHARADLLADFAGVERGIEPPADRQQPFELLQIGFDGGLHVGILQLAGERRAVERSRAMHLSERGRSGGMMLEALKFFLPVGAELRHHAALDEGPAHRRRFALQLLQFGGIFRRQQVGNGRQQLRDLHQRAFEPAERRGQRARFGGAVGLAAEHAPPGVTRRHAADIGADAGITRRAGGEAVFFAVGWFAVCHYCFGQLSRIQRARLSSLTSPAASERIILVACA